MIYALKLLNLWVNLTFFPWKVHFTIRTCFFARNHLGSEAENWVDSTGNVPSRRRKIEIINKIKRKSPTWSRFKIFTMTILKFTVPRNYALSKNSIHLSSKYYLCRTTLVMHSSDLLETRRIIYRSRSTRNIASTSLNCRKNSPVTSRDSALVLPTIPTITLLIWAEECKCSL